MPHGAASTPSTTDHPRGRGDSVHGPRSAGASREHTPSTSPSPWCSREHPREYRTRVRNQPLDRKLGTIPAKAGAEPSRADARESEGTIPAEAVSSLGGRTKSLLRGPPLRAREPSPRVPGVEDLNGSALPLLGTIPAGAGSSSVRSRGRQRPWEHPRGCGDHPTLADIRTADPVWTRTRSTRDHPQGCGELRTLTIWVSVRSGPSPQARGAQRGRHQLHRLRGTIPAGAGSTASPPPSPRAREGADDRRRHAGTDDGTIPARRGEHNWSSACSASS